MGWQLFERGIALDPVPWAQAYNCLYYHYDREYPVVEKYLRLLRARPEGPAVSLWSRISALCALAGHTSPTAFLEDLHAIDMGEAWAAAAAVFLANLDAPKLQAVCARGLVDALRAPGHDAAVLPEMGRLFLDAEGRTIPLTVLEAYVDTRRHQGRRSAREAHHVGEWLASVALADPVYTLHAVELFLKHGMQFDTWDGAPYARMLTALFREAEECELSDGGEILRRGVAVQDALLRLEVASLDGWLQAAERQ